MVGTVVRVEAKNTHLPSKPVQCTTRTRTTVQDDSGYDSSDSEYKKVPYYESDSSSYDIVRRNERGQLLCKGRRNTCKSRARDTTSGLCVRCGGGERCDVCGKGARPGFSRCRKHGGGDRCSEFGCTKPALKHLLCADHGGKTLCIAESYTCPNQAQNGTKFCYDHGALKVKGNKCTWYLCTKLLRGRKKLCPKHEREQNAKLYNSDDDESDY